MENSTLDQSKAKFEQLRERFRQSLSSLVPFGVILWKKRKNFLLVNGAVALVSVAMLLLFAGPYYQSDVSILPDYGNKPLLGNLSQLASLAGVSVGETTPTDIYEGLLTTETVLAPVIYAKYQTEAFKDSVNLIDYFDIAPDKDLPPDLRERKMFLKVYDSFCKHRVKTDLNNLTKVLNVQVTMPESKLAADVVNRLIESLDNYVRTKRKSYATNQRFYLEKRVSQVKDSLTSAEEAFAKFQEENKVVSQSPQLQLEQSRFMREIDILQTVYGQLVQQLELAKIDEIRDTPVINLAEFAKEPIIKAGPKRLLILLFIMTLTFASSGFFLVYEEELRTLWSDLSHAKRKIFIA